MIQLHHSKNKVMKKQIEISGKLFTSTELKEQIEKQWQASSSGRWGNSSIPQINEALLQAGEELFSKTHRTSKTATLRRAYEILRDGKLR
jgi:hypothetical protein